MGWRYAGRLLVFVHGPKNPSGLEWHRFLNETGALTDRANARILVVSYGGGPDVDQRKLLARAIGNTPAPTVIMTNSTMVRAITHALGFFNRYMKAVGLHDTEAAFAHLGLNADERREAQRQRAELEAELGISAVKA